MKDVLLIYLKNSSASQVDWRVAAFHMTYSSTIGWVILQATFVSVCVCIAACLFERSFIFVLMWS